MASITAPSLRFRIPALNLGKSLKSSILVNRGIVQSRTYASSSSTSTSSSSLSQSWDAEPVDLSYDLVEPPKPSSSGQSLVICHGLFGSKQNWRSLAKMFAQRLGMPVYTLDLRNHGHSPHAEPHTYTAMALDLARFMNQRGLDSGVNLVGHSMGGKAVMAYALNPDINKPLRSLISVDMSPAVGKISPEFASYAESMLEVENAKVKTKAEADQILKKVEPTLPTRQFLLTNTRTSPSGHLTFRIPLPLLHRAIPHIGDFPYRPPHQHQDSNSSSDSDSPTSTSTSASASGPVWEGPTLFLKGEHSRYLNKNNIPIAKMFFPNMRLEVLDTGHWVHAEKPAETVGLIDEFVKGIKS